MRRLGIVALGVTAAALAAAPARAADLPVPAPAPSYYPAAFPAIYDWTGLYIGGQVGVGVLSDNVSEAATGLTVLTGSIPIGVAGVVGGAQAGANYQFQTWVVGIEGAWNATDLTGSGTVLTTTPSLERATSAPVWFASATGRFGYAADALLGYVKAGGAWMSVNYTQEILIGGVTASQALHDYRDGFTVGAGLEYGLTEHFSAKLEYDFYDFGSRSYNGFVQTPVSIRSDLHTLLFALDYRFTWPGSIHPVAAKD